MQTLYFPDYDDVLPTIDGFVDSSYGNDLCPSIYSETLKLRIYCDYKDEAKREGCGMRYNVTIDDGTEALLETDDLVVVLEFIEIQRLFTALALARAHARLELFDRSPEKCRNGKPIDQCTCC